LRKTFFAAGLAALALVPAGVAQAQNPAPVLTATAKVSPGKSGTKSKPKSVKFNLRIENSQESKTSADGVVVTLPSTLKLSTTGLTQCTATDEEIIADPSTCNSAKVGSGTAGANLAQFQLTAFAGKNEVLFYLDSPVGQFVLHGKISGKKMTIPIGPTLQQPVPGLFAYLHFIEVNLSKKKGNKYLVSTTGCKSKKHTIGVSATYVPNPTPPAATSASTEAEAACS
jgi:hypothetical protein